MNPLYRDSFNRAFSEARYQALLDFLTAEAGFEIPFRICETPIFLTERLSRRLIDAAQEIVEALRTPEYQRYAERAIPPGSRVPGPEGHTAFLQIDFALAVGEGGEVVPQLIELQGFPSLYGFQYLLDRGYRHAYDLPVELVSYFTGLDTEGYVRALRELIVADEEPENVVLLEIEPEEQKTRVDFVVTEKLLGIPTVCAVHGVRERGGKLFYSRNGREIPIHRIYNRVIFDEIERKGIDLSPIFGRELDVTWVGAPALVLEDQQILAALSGRCGRPPLRASLQLRLGAHRDPRGPRELRAEAALLLRRPGSRDRRHARAPAGARAAGKLHPATPGRVRTGHRHPRRPGQGRGADDVRL